MVANFMTLKIAAEMSVKVLESSYPEDISLLYLFGCLPAGITKEQVQTMWN